MSKSVMSRLKRVDAMAARFSTRAAIPLVRLGLAIVYLWFGIHKLFPGVSVVESLVVRTVSALTFGVIDGPAARLTAAVTEIVIGLVLLSGRLPRTTAVLLLAHVALTSAPLLLFPDEMWKGTMLVTLEAQYILKNAITVGAAVVIAASAYPRIARTHRPAPQLPQQRNDQDEVLRSREHAAG